MEHIYYDKDANLSCLKNKTVGIIGYGIQGRAQALNLRDSGVKTIIANRNDRYARQAANDGFKVFDFKELTMKSDIILFLISDQAQEAVFRKHIQSYFKTGSMLVFAHGYALRFKTIKLPKDIDVAMLAPRMPGYQIRNYFIQGKGVPAFIDIAQDKTGFALEKLLGLAKAIGFTRAGVLEVSFKVEAELDLFTEQFLVSAIIKLIDTSFKILTREHGYPPIATLMELYASGELSEVLMLASKSGIGKVFQKNASPTCQCGIALNFNDAIGSNPEKRARRIIREIKNRKFKGKLDIEAKSGYSTVRKLWKEVNSDSLSFAQDWINKSFKTRTGDKVEISR